MWMCVIKDAGRCVHALVGASRVRRVERVKGCGAIKGRLIALWETGVLGWGSTIICS